ncbi:FAD-binding oxidoreductase [Ornithinimicrobium avium]|uniref:FAD-binding oxidoreductase n=1 Tax=Ornithinimicrobium avium TaxID=2283195 RepID=UPI0013B45F08|nr:FAD-binding oxidoreductase [Ornithinimicrobium avium]
MTPAVAELTLRPEGRHLTFAPGQYVLVSDENDRFPVRSYSVANAPDPSGSIRLLVTRVDKGRTSPWLTTSMPLGTSVMLSGPYGTFVVDPRSERPILCVAGGSGLAPVLSLAEAAVLRGTPRSFSVLFSARSEADLMYEDRFASWQAEQPGFRYVRTLTRAPGPPPVGRVGLVLPEIVPDLSGHDVFVAGAPGLVATVCRVAQDLGCVPGAVRTEAFFADPQGAAPA